MSAEYRRIGTTMIVHTASLHLLPMYSTKKRVLYFPATTDMKLYIYARKRTKSNLHTSFCVALSHKKSSGGKITPLLNVVFCAALFCVVRMNIILSTFDQKLLTSMLLARSMNGTG